MFIFRNVSKALKRTDGGGGGVDRRTDLEKNLHPGRHDDPDPDFFEESQIVRPSGQKSWIHQSIFDDDPHILSAAGRHLRSRQPADRGMRDVVRSSDIREHFAGLPSTNGFPAFLADVEKVTGRSG
jgi:hypothetical protein